MYTNLTYGEEHLISLVTTSQFSIRVSHMCMQLMEERFSFQWQQSADTGLNDQVYVKCVRREASYLSYDQRGIQIQSIIYMHKTS